MHQQCSSAVAGAVKKLASHPGTALASKRSGPHQRIGFWKACRAGKAPSALMISLVEPCQRYRMNPKDYGQRRVLYPEW
jgi:hypothetical protein